MKSHLAKLLWCCVIGTTAITFAAPPPEDVQLEQFLDQFGPEERLQVQRGLEIPRSGEARPPFPAAAYQAAPETLEYFRHKATSPRQLQRQLNFYSSHPDNQLPEIIEVAKSIRIPEERLMFLRIMAGEQENVLPEFTDTP